jgi:hydrogenase maturation protein HypF
MNTLAPDRSRLTVCVRGAVQGVGFRPFIYRLASQLSLQGWVSNTVQGVWMDVEGSRTALETFLLRLESDKPPRSSIHSLEASWLEPVGHAGFEIRQSQLSGPKTALVLPDIATCQDCLAEIFDPHNRRHRYPFTNCTNCGPRFSIIESLPYDRANTSMKGFRMCLRCQAEYDDPLDRRFHAQPNACPECGPQLEFKPGQGLQSAELAGPTARHDALMAAARAIRKGLIVAVKGLGGFHLMVDASQDNAVRRLRERKHREEKPLAVMFPSLERLKSSCEISPLEERLLRSPEAPIVLLQRTSQSQSQISQSIAPGNPNLGALLPYTPLHHLLLSELDFPVVATSGNLSDEPICIDEAEAMVRLGNIADCFLFHNRPIVRHVDDSIVRLMAGRELVLRRARGYAPLPITLDSGLSAPEAPSVLAVGAHLKNAVALSVGPQVFISQHIGDLETDQAFEAFQRVIADFQKLYESTPVVVAADAHPEYLSTQFARRLAAGPAGAPRLVTVQHHMAHVLSCMAENGARPPALGVSWDGTGYGLDGTIWGGEFFLVQETGCERFAHFRTFPLPGGDKGVKEPRRAALGLLFEAFGERAFEMNFLKLFQNFAGAELSTLRNMLDKKLNSPRTSSVGRLFDAVASLAGVRQQTNFEGQSAMELEFAATTAPPGSEYEFLIETERAPLVVNWAPVVESIVGDVRTNVPAGEISDKFHSALAESIVAVARRAGLPAVILSGGCFQNRLLTERTVARLREKGHRPYWHQRVPPNDGGIALGQVVAARKLDR